jgi:RNA polymerase sigma-70 factor (ECF subfamily)
VGEAGVAVLVPGTSLDDRERLEQILRSVRPAVYRYSRARLWDSETAEDVTQDVLMALVEALPRQTEEVRDMNAFALGIAAHHVATAHRRRSSRPETATPELPDLVDDVPGPDDVATLHDQADRLRALLELLSPVQRDVVLLRVVNGLSAEDTGEALGLAPGTVRVTQHRALHRLRALANQEVAV